MGIASPEDHPNCTFATEEGRSALFHSWQTLRSGAITQEMTEEQRAASLTEWLRWCITEKALDPHARLPPYNTIAAYLHLDTTWVTASIQQLRKEGLLPKRKTRLDKNQYRWTDRDTYLWEYIGFMRALRFDQARRLLAREATQEPEEAMLSISRTSEIIGRWTDARYVIFKPIFHGQPGWLWLTRRGLHQVELKFRADTPSVRLLEHLYWINEVRMRLEEEHDDLEWISERELQAEQNLRQKGQSVVHIPDGIVILPGKDGSKEAIDIEVQISRPSPGEVENVMGDLFFTKSRNALRYYVTRRSRGIVRAAWEKMKHRSWVRPRIEIIDLETWMPL